VRGLYVNCSGSGQIRVCYVLPDFFHVNFRKKMSFCEVHVHFDCADLHKARGWLCSVPKVSFYRRAALIFWVMSCPFFVASVGHSRHFEVWNMVLPDKHKISDTFSSAWQAWHFRNRANILAGVDPNNIWFWRLFFVARAVFDELGSTIVFCELSSHWNFWHDDDSVWHVQHLGCLALIFRDRRSTL
jgi:hypothetical protein